MTESMFCLQDSNIEDWLKHRPLTCRTSVVSVNCRMSQKPKMAVTFWPGTIGSMSPPLLMLLAMTSAPASPNPTASRLHVQKGCFSHGRWK